MVSLMQDKPWFPPWITVFIRHRIVRDLSDVWGVPFLLERHLKRMAEGCKELGIPFAQDVEQLQEWIQRVMDKK